MPFSCFSSQPSTSPPRNPTPEAPSLDKSPASPAAPSARSSPSATPPPASKSRTLSDATGNFRFAEVTPGNYAVRVNAPGAAPWHAYDVTVEIGRTTQLAPRMTVAFFDHPKREHEYHAPETNLTPAVSSNVDQQFIESLPSSAGHWSAFAALAGGAAPDAGGSNALSFRGLSPLMNAITLDGADHTLAFRASERGATGSGYSTPKDAVSQFQVNTSNFSAQYGGAGGSISSVTRSGGNTLHAEASFRDRDAAWGAMNAWTRIMQTEPAGTLITSTGAPVQYVNGQPITYVDTPFRAPDQRLHAALDTGGPIRRNRLFWFTASEYSRRNFPGIARANEPETFFAAPSAQTVQTLAARIVTSTNPIYLNCATTPIDLNAQASCAYDAVQNQLSKLLGSVPRTATQINFFPKIDWRINNRIHLVGQYNYMTRTSPNGVLTGATETYGTGSFGNSSSSENAATGRLEYFFTPSLLTSVRYQYSRDLLSQLAATPTTFEQQFANSANGRRPRNLHRPQRRIRLRHPHHTGQVPVPAQTRQRFANSATWIHHRHALRFGYDYNHVIDSVNGLNGQDGEYSYSSLANFVADMLAPTTATEPPPAPAPTPATPPTVRPSATPSGISAPTTPPSPPMTGSSRRASLSRSACGTTTSACPTPTSPSSIPTSHKPRLSLTTATTSRRARRLRMEHHPHRTHRPPRRLRTLLHPHSQRHRLQRAHLHRRTAFRPNLLLPPAGHRSPALPLRLLQHRIPYTNPTAPDALSSAPNAVYFDKHFQNAQIDQAELSLQQELGQRTAITITAMASFGRELPQFLDRNIDLNNVATLNYVLDTTTNPQHLGPIKSNFTSPFYYARVNPAADPSPTSSVTQFQISGSRHPPPPPRRAQHRPQRRLHLLPRRRRQPVEATFANFNNVYDPANLAIEHGTSNFDVRQRASGGVVAHVPWRFNRLAGSILNGYMLSTYGEWRQRLHHANHGFRPYRRMFLSGMAAGGRPHRRRKLRHGQQVRRRDRKCRNRRAHPRPRPRSLNGSGGRTCCPR